MHLLITGSNGLLGQKIVAHCRIKNIEFTATSKGENRNPDCPAKHYNSLDISKQSEVNQLIEKINPTHIIHTAAITNVDQCETDQALCAAVNVKATEYLVAASNKVKAHFQFISTDFVFDGEKGNYKEEDPVRPLSIYGKSKVSGEEIVMKNCHGTWSIVRTIIVYGEGHNLSRGNLILWAKNALEKNAKINIIDDQFRAPTYAKDLAKACIDIVTGKHNGVFHIAGPQTFSIFEIVEVVASYFKYSMENVSKISSSVLNQAAKRPPKTGFDLSKAKNTIAYNPLTIQESLKEMFA